MRIDEILAFNERFVEQTHLPTIGHAPRKQMALVTCMDCRLVNMFEQALGLERGDVLELRTAGATIPDPERQAARSDLIRSLAGGLHPPRGPEGSANGPTPCALSHCQPTALPSAMQR